MKKIITCCTLLACALCAHAYELVATVGLEEETKWHFDIELANNDIDFTAFQLDITINGDAKLEREDMTSGLLMHNHTLMVAKPEDYYRVAGYSLSCATFKEKEGSLFSFSINGDINGIIINRVFFVKPDGTKVEAAVNEVSDQQNLNEVTFDMKDKQTYRIDSRGIYIGNGKIEK